MVHPGRHETAPLQIVDILRDVSHQLFALYLCLSISVCLSFYLSICLSCCLSLGPNAFCLVSSFVARLSLGLYGYHHTPLTIPSCFRDLMHRLTLISGALLLHTSTELSSLPRRYRSSLRRAWSLSSISSAMKSGELPCLLSSDRAAIINSTRRCGCAVTRSASNLCRSCWPCMHACCCRMIFTQSTGCARLAVCARSFSHCIHHSLSVPGYVVFIWTDLCRPWLRLYSRMHRPSSACAWGFTSSDPHDVVRVAS